MIEVRPDPKLVDAIRDALRARHASLPAVSMDAVAPVSSASSPISEESLRCLMVSYYPQIQRRKPMSEEGAIALAIIDVAAAADWGDMRYIDALNALYEVWGGNYMPELRELFLQRYRDALTRMLSMVD